MERKATVTLEEAWKGGNVTVAGVDGNGTALRIKIPSGVAEGTKVRIKGKGHKGRNGGPQGDIIVTFSIQPHDRFRVQGSDLQTYYEVPFTVAALGGTIEFTHIDGSKRSLKIPAFPNGDTVFAARDEGMTLKDGTRGELLIKMKAVLPSTLSEKQKKLLRQFEDESTKKTYKSDSMAAVEAVD